MEVLGQLDFGVVNRRSKTRIELVDSEREFSEDTLHVSLAWRCLSSMEAFNIYLRSMTRHGKLRVFIAITESKKSVANLDLMFRLWFLFVRQPETKLL